MAEISNSAVAGAVRDTVRASPVKSAALVHRMLLAAQKLVGPYRTMFERIFVNGEPEEVVQASLGLTKQDFSQMMRALAASAH